ncbi:flagellar basal body P-ring formation chaperone FlgA [Bacterioplanes sanyensis]|uniref:flagellar basal body P-ring formation chaperone FlgA n=1 Tax=Bacterioplanes sanyensis TaxID=1249553 RepID=UPI0016782482|nr:flagellar basal body P-ring formation chaperone FlgA [Bacterioplanes sanyensis]
MTTIAFISLVACSPAAISSAPTEPVWRQQLEQRLIQQWRRQTGIQEQASITFIGMSTGYQPPRCRLPLEIDTGRPLQAGRNGIALRCDSPYWSQNLAIQLHHMADLVVLARPVASDQILTSDDVRLARLDTGEQTKGYYRNLDKVIGKQVKRSLRPGTVLSADMLEQPNLVERRQRVRIQVIRPGIQVEMPGEAMASGHLGERIRVRNLQSQRIIQATVTAAGVVQVQ